MSMFVEELAVPVWLAESVTTRCTLAVSIVLGQNVREVEAPVPAEVPSMVQA
jgi:hypothetical protein